MPIGIRRPVSAHVPQVGAPARSAAPPAGAFTIRVRDPVTGHAAQFAVNDRLRVKVWNGTAVVDNWLRVDVVTDPGASFDYFEYEVTLMAGTPGVIPAGAAIVNYGPSGSGVVRATSDETASPFVDVSTHTGSPWSAMTSRARIGNLDGVLGLAAQYGLAAGVDLSVEDDTARSIVASNLQALIRNFDIAAYSGGAQRLDVAATGNFKSGADVAAGDVSFALFGVGETFNGEAFGAGDALFGFNGAGLPSLLWNESDSRIDIRDGTTLAGFIDDGFVTMRQVGGYRLIAEGPSYSFDSRLFPIAINSEADIQTIVQAGPTAADGYGGSVLLRTYDDGALGAYLEVASEFGQSTIIAGAADLVGFNRLYAGAIASIPSLAAGEIRAASYLTVSDNGGARYRSQTLTLSQGSSALIGPVNKTFGIVWILDTTDGSAACYVLRGQANATQEIWDSPAGAFSGTEDSAADNNVYYDSPNARYELQNNRGTGTHTYQVFILTVD